MKKSFTLIELIFVIVIIGLLASFAAPKFLATKEHASGVSAKSVVSSVRTAVGTKHGEWMINSCGSLKGYTPQGYPQVLDNVAKNTAGKDLFVGTDDLEILKTGVRSCLNNDCWFKYKDNDTDKNISYYEYKFNDNSFITLDYNGSTGEFKCNNDSQNNGSDLNITQCESIIN